MKILIDNSCNRIGEGIASSFFWIPDSEVSWWLSDIKPTMDMFDETSPDMVVVRGDKLLTPELKIASSRYPHTKIISVGEIANELQIEPSLSISKSNAKGIPTIYFDDAAMIGQIGFPPAVPYLQTDILCSTDYINKNDKTNSILSFLCENYNIKIFGKQKVSFPNYLGEVNTPTWSQALASTIIYVDLDGGSWYDAAWLGKESISISEACPDSFDNIEELQPIIDKILKEGRTSTRSEEIKLRMKNQTYFELVGEILSFFGLPEQRGILMEKKKEITC